MVGAGIDRRDRRTGRDHRITVWEIYVWAVLNSLVRLVSRPAYKALLTESVPVSEARSAMAVSSMTETGSLVAVTAVGAVLLSAVGLTAAFILNGLELPCGGLDALAVADSGLPVTGREARLTAAGALSDLREGFGYLWGMKALLYPLLLTFVLMLATSPLITLLAAVVHARGESLIDLGLLSAATSLGTFAGAAYAGARRPPDDPSGRYARLGLLAAFALALFAMLPLGVESMAPLAVIGLIYGVETVGTQAAYRSSARPPIKGACKR